MGERRFIGSDPISAKLREKWWSSAVPSSQQDGMKKFHQIHAVLSKHKLDVFH